MCKDRGQPRAFRQGEVLRHFLDFTEKFYSKFWIFLYVLYFSFIKTSQLKIGRSQFKETFSLESPTRLSPGKDDFLLMVYHIYSNKFPHNLFW